MLLITADFLQYTEYSQHYSPLQAVSMGPILKLKKMLEEKQQQLDEERAIAQTAQKKLQVMGALFPEI